MTWLLAETDWTLVSAFSVAIVALSSTIWILWNRYNDSRDKVEAGLQDQVNRIVPLMERFAATASELNQSARELLAEAVRQRERRDGRGP